MADLTNTYIGGIRMFAGMYPPSGWAFCDGRLLPMASNRALFALLGTTYGGDGIKTFGLPDMRGRIGVSAGTAKSGTAYARGATGGSETVNIAPESVPAHRHQLYASSMQATTLSPVNGSYAATAPHVLLYPDASKPVAPDRYFSRDTIGPSGGSPRPEPHPNIMPSLGVNFMIALTGIMPDRGP